MPLHPSQYFIMAEQQPEKSNFHLALSPTGEIKVEPREEADTWEDLPIENGDLEMKMEDMKLGEGAEVPFPPTSVPHEGQPGMAMQFESIRTKIRDVNIRMQYRKEDKKAADPREWKAKRSALAREHHDLHKQRRKLLAKANGLSFEQFEDRRKRNKKPKTKKNRDLQSAQKALEKMSLG